MKNVNISYLYKTVVDIKIITKRKDAQPRSANGLTGSPNHFILAAECIYIEPS